MTTTIPRFARRHAVRRLAGLTGALLVLGSLAACEPEPPEKERPPEPQAAAQHTQMRDAIHAPIERAREVETDVEDAAEAQREAIEAATGG